VTDLRREARAALADALEHDAALHADVWLRAADPHLAQVHFRAAEILQDLADGMRRPPEAP
jgi:hypothetical protein